MFTRFITSVLKKMMSSRRFRMQTSCMWLIDSCKVLCKLLIKCLHPHTHISTRTPIVVGIVVWRDRSYMFISVWLAQLFQWNQNAHSTCLITNPFDSNNWLRHSGTYTAIHTLCGGGGGALLYNTGVENRVRTVDPMCVCVCVCVTRWHCVRSRSSTRLHWNCGLAIFTLYHFQLYIQGKCWDVFECADVISSILPITIVRFANMSAHVYSAVSRIFYLIYN